MKPAPFTYHAPKSVDAALRTLADAEDPDEVKIVAGGQSLIPMLALRLAQPEQLLDVNGLAGELGFIRRDGQTLRIGALARQREAERSPDVARYCPLLAEALPVLAHPQIRNRGTLGGSIAHADPAAEFPAIAVALEARISVVGPAGERVIAAADFFRGFLTTAMDSDELLTQIDLPVLPEGSGSCFLEVSRRHGDFAMVGVAAVVVLSAGRVVDTRLAFSGVAGVPVRAAAAEDLLRGAEPSSEAVRAAAAAAADALRPPSDIHGSASYRRHVARVLAARALTTAVERARS